MNRLDLIVNEYRQNEIPSAVIICGPTCSGKSSLAIETAEKLNGEIISCDSMQIYKHMNVGTAKPSPEDMQKIPHHMIDICEPWENYNVFLYKGSATQVIRDIISRGKVPVICGGTGLYVNSLIDNRHYVDEDSEECIPERFRDDLQLALSLYSQGEYSRLHGILEKYDPEASKAFHKNNSKRVLRALKLYFLTGQTRTEREEASLKVSADLNFNTFVLTSERDTLYRNIDNRVDSMREQGLYEEAVRVYELCREKANATDAAFDHRSLNSLAAIGYREFYEYPQRLNGRLTAEAIGECFDKIKQDTRHYAKRQITWFKKTPGAVYI